MYSKKIKILRIVYVLVHQWPDFVLIWVNLFVLLPQPDQQNKAKQLGWCGIIINKKTTATPQSGRMWYAAWYAY
jgi:hypothetical protein